MSDPELRPGVRQDDLTRMKPLADDRRRRRIARNIVSALASAVALAVVFTFAPGRSTIEKASLSTAYVSLLFLALTLSVGPARILRRRKSPLSTHLRRDLGLWTTMLAASHVWLGLQVHMGGRLASYFIVQHRAPNGSVTAGDAAFATANWLGLAATIALILLAAISNDFSLRAMGARLWKNVQRSSYVALVVVAFHGALYQLVEQRSVWLVMSFVLILLIVSGLQTLGAAARRTGRHVAEAARHPEPLLP